MDSLPKELRRIDDGAIYVLGEDKLYTNKKSMMYSPHKYTYLQLMSTGAFEEIK